MPTFMGPSAGSKRRFLVLLSMMAYEVAPVAGLAAGTAAPIMKSEMVMGTLGISTLYSRYTNKYTKRQSRSLRTRAPSDDTNTRTGTSWSQAAEPGSLDRISLLMELRGGYFVTTAESGGAPGVPS